MWCVTIFFLPSPCFLYENVVSMGGICVFPLKLAKLGVRLVVGKGMWLWWAVLLPKGVSGQFISLLSTAVCECARECVCFPAFGSAANSMAVAQLQHYSNTESLCPSTVCLQIIYKFKHNTSSYFQELGWLSCGPCFSFFLSFCRLHLPEAVL